MYNFQNESLLVSGLQNIESQVQNKVISQIYKMRQLTMIDSQVQNESFNQDEIDPRIKNKYVDLRNKIQFENKEDEVEFLNIIIQWNQCLEQNKRLNQQVMDKETQLIQYQQQIEFPVSKIHEIDYEENQQISQLSLLISQDQRIENQIQEVIKIDKSTQTDKFDNRDDKNEQTDLKDLDKEDNQNMIEFFNSSFYKDLQNKQFLVNAQLISLIQTMFLMHNERKIEINDVIQQQIDNLIKRMKQKDQISYNTIIMMKESVEV
ncbi:unnamed protein product [Paramecium sonneborni]|uniref:Uncharacterized protein n=1 Tax=Paramecium sonneborni TaxID=65129 RepID=A0A8S1LNW1_9CILI|nr:unnamed protein product [Paramecium sonneborni]